MARRAAVGKRRSPQVARFLLDVDRQCDALAEELRTQTYQPRLGRAFWICDPKPRCIYALPFRDRVVQHLLIAETLPAIERRLVAQTYACRVGMGTHLCLRRAAALQRTHSNVLRIDFQKYFPSIDHLILRRLLNRVTPLEWRWLRDRFLDAPVMTERADFHFPSDDPYTPLVRPHGLPIGSLTSQIWANLYLSPIDHALTSYLGIGTWVRYSDDVLVYHNDADRLHAALRFLTDRAMELRLRLHPRKTCVQPTTEPLPFLGFELRRVEHSVSVRLRSENLDRMRQRVRALRSLFAAGAIELTEVTARLHAWLAHARHGHTQSLIERELARWTFARSPHPPATCAPGSARRGGSV